MTRSTPRSTALVLVALAGMACSHGTGSAAPVAPAPAPTASSGAQASAPPVKLVSDSVRQRYTAADVHFMTGMIGHHAQAVLMAAGTNLIGAFLGTAVAATIASGLINAGVIEMSSQLLICALLAAIVWNLITWWLGLPSSSSHALVGALVGAAIAASANNFGSVIWEQDGWLKGQGVIPKVVIPMVLSPLAGFITGTVLPVDGGYLAA